MNEDKLEELKKFDKEDALNTHVAYGAYEEVYVTSAFLQYAHPAFLQMREDSFIFLGMTYDIVGESRDDEEEVVWYRCKRRKKTINIRGES